MIDTCSFGDIGIAMQLVIIFIKLSRLSLFLLSFDVTNVHIIIPEVVRLWVVCLPVCYKTQQRLICKHVPTASRLSHITLIHQSFHHLYLNKDEGILIINLLLQGKEYYTVHTYIHYILPRRKKKSTIPVFYVVLMHCHVGFKSFIWCSLVSLKPEAISDVP